MKKMIFLTLLIGITASVYGIRDDQKEDVEKIKTFMDAFKEETITNIEKAHLFADKMYHNKRFKAVISRSPKFIRTLIKENEVAAAEAVRLDDIIIYIDSLTETAHPYLN